MPRPRAKRFKVVRGDAECWFPYDRELTEKKLTDLCNAREQSFDKVFPGLLLKDDDGNILEPELKITFKESDDE